MRNKFVLILSLLANFCFAQNIAYIQQDSIMKTIPSYQMQLKSLDSVTKNYQKEIKTLQEEWNIKVTMLLKPYNLKENENMEQIKSRMSVVDTTKLSILLDEDKIIVKKAKNYDAIVQQQYQTDIQPILDKVNNAISSYAKKNKIDMVYIIEQIRPALAYIDERKNITNAIIELLKKS